MPQPNTHEPDGPAWDQVFEQLAATGLPEIASLTAHVRHRCVTAAEAFAIIAFWQERRGEWKHAHAVLRNRLYHARHGQAIDAHWPARNLETE